MAKSKKNDDVRKLAPDLELSLKLRRELDRTFTALEATLSAATERNPELARRLHLPLKEHKDAIRFMAFGDPFSDAAAKRKRR